MAQGFKKHLGVLSVTDAVATKTIQCWEKDGVWNKAIANCVLSCAVQIIFQVCKMLKYHVMFKGKWLEHWRKESRENEEALERACQYWSEGQHFISSNVHI